MLENKYINFIIIAFMAISVLFTSILVISPQSLGLSPSSQEEVAYASKLFDKNAVSEINIDMSEEDWNWIIENAVEEEYRSGNITINGETFYNVGIRPKGNSSLRTVAQDDTTDRFSFKIKFNQYVKGQNYHGLDELVINNMITDATYMKEYLAYDLFEKMNIVTPLYAFSNIQINNEPWGLYLAVEVTEDSFLSRSFGNASGNLYRPEDSGSSLKWVDDNHSSYQGIKDNAQTKITEEDFDKVIGMIKTLNSGTDLENYLDVDEILRYFAVNNLLVNLDSYVGNFNHNYLLYEKNGIFSILPWDLNMAFGGFQSRSGQQAIDLSIDTPYSGNSEDYPLFSKLLEVPEYKQIYDQYLAEAVALYFDSGLFKVTVEQLDQLINEYVKNDQTAFYTYEEYTASLPVLKEFGKLRANSVLAQLAGETTAGTVNLDLSALGSMGGGGGMGNMPNGMDGMPAGMNRRPEAMNANTVQRPNNINGNGERQRPNIDNAPMNMEDSNIGNENNMENINPEKEQSDFRTPPNNIPFNEDNRGRDGGFPGGNMGRGGNMPRTSQNLMPSLILTGISTFVLFMGILFVYKFKRRKYAKGFIQ